MTKTLLPKHYSPTREEILKALGAISEIEYNKMWRSLDEKTKEINELVQKMHILESRLDRAKMALCEVSQLSLQDNVDISRFYDIAHYAITELNKELK